MRGPGLFVRLQAKDGRVRRSRNQNHRLEQHRRIVVHIRAGAFEDPGLGLAHHPFLRLAFQPDTLHTIAQDMIKILCRILEIGHLGIIRRPGYESHILVRRLGSQHPVAVHFTGPVVRYRNRELLPAILRKCFVRSQRGGDQRDGNAKDGEKGVIHR